MRRNVFRVVGLLLLVGVGLEVVYELLPPQRGQHLVVQLHHLSGPAPALLVADADADASQYVVPKKPQKDWKRPPCKSAMDEHPINGACWQRTTIKPPCGPLYEYEGRCYRPIAVLPRLPSAIDP